MRRSKSFYEYNFIYFKECYFNSCPIYHTTYSLYKQTAIIMKITNDRENEGLEEYNLFSSLYKEMVIRGLMC